MVWVPSRPPGGGCGREVFPPPIRSHLRFCENTIPKKIGASTYSEMFAGSDYSDAEWEFIQAIMEYQKRWKRRYPTWREVLHVLHTLGYRKIAHETTERRIGPLSESATHSASNPVAM